MNSKEELRNKFRIIRTFDNPLDKSNVDSIIQFNVLNSDFWMNADIVLCYTSVNTEVDTIGIIKQSLLNNKIVAVPFCCGDNMNFYRINGFDDLCLRQFGIPTVDIKSSELIIPDSKALCIVPALSFDKRGFRLGYGGGFYDRYFQKFNPIKLGLAYSKCVVDVLPSEKHDVKVDFLITENAINSFNF